MFSCALEKICYWCWYYHISYRTSILKLLDSNRHNNTYKMQCLSIKIIFYIFQINHKMNVKCFILYPATTVRDLRTSSYLRWSFYPTAAGVLPYELEIQAMFRTRDDYGAIFSISNADNSKTIILEVFIYLLF